jgi:DNA-binding LytR/AlgR family response regulator
LIKKILIVEDETLISEELSLIIQSLGYEVVGIANNESDALALVQKENPDLVCLDIDLKAGGSGFNIASKLEIPFLFITSFFDEITLAKAKDYSPYSYIVKPFRDIDIKSNLSLAFFKIESQIETKPSSVVGKKEELFIKKDGEAFRIDSSEILYLKGEDNYSVLHMTDGSKHMTSTTLKKMNEKLEPFGFIRVHKSYSVSIAKVTGFQGSTIYLTEKAIPIGKAFRSNLRDRFTVL